MAQQHFQQQFYSFNQSAGPMPNRDLNYNAHIEQDEFETATQPTSRRDETNRVFETLYNVTSTLRPGERDTIGPGGRRNRNDILGRTVARLNKEKYLHGNKYGCDVELLRGIQMNSNNGEFVIVLRPNGRIVAMSDEIETHLGKAMRSLYTQFKDIFECLDDNDSEKLRLILNSSNMSHEEHRLVCTLRLPKGKRPSRVYEDIKSITMAGHFYSCHGSSALHERLFIARCEALLSSTVIKSNPLRTATILNNINNANATIKLTLNDDMSIHLVSPNVKDILGYTMKEMFGNWLGRYLVASDLEKFEVIRRKYFQQDQRQQQKKQSPTSICDVFDMYTNNGDGRLTFLYQIRPTRERRSKSLKFTIVAQLIDPSLRADYIKYIQSESQTNSNLIKAEQVNFGAQLPSSVSTTSEDTIMANSPSLIPGLLIFENFDSNDSPQQQSQQQYSPLGRSLSNVVAPVDFSDEFWPEQLDDTYNQYASSSATCFNENFFEYPFDEDLKSFIDEYITMC